MAVTLTVPILPPLASPPLDYRGRPPVDAEGSEIAIPSLSTPLYLFLNDLVLAVQALAAAVPGGGGGTVAAITLYTDVLLTANLSVTSPGAPSANGQLWLLRLRQNSTGGWAVTWPSDVFNGPFIDATTNSDPDTMCLCMFVGIGSNWNAFPANGVPIS